MRDGAGPTPPLGLMALVLVAVFFLSFQPIDSTDFWWHLAVGRTAVETGAVPFQDPYSFTRPGGPWTPHSWLLDVAAYLVYRVAGFAGVHVLVPLAAGLLVIPLFFLLTALAGSVPGLSPARARGVALLCLFFLFLPARVAFSLRPNMASLLLFIWLLAMLEGPLARWRRPAFAAATFALFVLWANCHGGFVSGLVLLAVYLVAPPAEAGRGARGTLLVCLALGAVAGLCTVNGRDLYAAVLDVRGFSQDAIREWRSPDFHLFWPFAWYTAGTFLALSVAPARPAARHALLYAFWLQSFLYSVRHLPFFCLATAVVLARPLASLAALAPSGARGRLGAAFRDVVGADTWRQLLLVWALLAALAVGSAATGRAVPGQPAALVPAARYPSDRMLDEVRRLPPDARVLAAYDWGGYLVWWVPERKVFIDGRTDLYAGEVLDDFLAITACKPSFETLLDKWRLTHLLLKRDEVLGRLGERLGWKRVADDPAAVLYELPGGAR